MPAQTHGRARNGFHIFATSSSFKKNLNPPPCDTTDACYKAYCCGPAIQPFGIRPRGCKRGGLCSFTPNRGRKRALALGGVGSRSSTIKRAITRRVENRNQMSVGYVPSAIRPRNSTAWPTANAICKPGGTCSSSAYDTEYECTRHGPSEEEAYVWTPISCPCCTITMTKNHPRNACLGSCQNRARAATTPQWTLGTILNNSNFNTAIDWYLGPASYKAAIIAVFGDIEDWDTSSEDMNNMDNAFGLRTSSVTGVPLDTTTFNANLNKSGNAWNTEHVTTMAGMFNGASAFQGNGLSNWDITQLENTRYMFNNAIKFNEDISDWDMSSVVDMNSMFNGATSFNRDLSKWDISSIPNASSVVYCFDGATDMTQTFSDTAGGGNWNATLTLLPPIIGFYVDGSNYIGPDVFPLQYPKITV